MTYYFRHLFAFRGFGGPEVSPGWNPARCYKEALRRRAEAQPYRRSMVVPSFQRAENLHGLGAVAGRDTPALPHDPFLTGQAAICGRRQDTSRCDKRTLSPSFKTPVHRGEGRSSSATSERSCTRSRTTSRPSGETSKSRMSNSGVKLVNCRSAPVSRSMSQRFLC